MIEPDIHQTGERRPTDSCPKKEHLFPFSSLQDLKRYFEIKYKGQKHHRCYVMCM